MMRKIVGVLVLFLVVGIADGLSSPWWVLHGRLRNALGVDPSWAEVGSLIGNPSESFEVSIVVNSTRSPWQTAQDLATLLNRFGPYEFGNTSVELNLFWGNIPVVPQPFPKSPERAANVVRHAFAGHPFFLNVRSRDARTKAAEGFMPRWFVIEFTPNVVQFYADNLLDPYGNINEVAADSFDQILQLRTNGPQPNDQTLFITTTQNISS